MNFIQTCMQQLLSCRNCCTRNTWSHFTWHQKASLCCDSVVHTTDVVLRMTSSQKTERLTVPHTLCKHSLYTRQSTPIWHYVPHPNIQIQATFCHTIYIHQHDTTHTSVLLGLCFCSLHCHLAEIDVGGPGPCVETWWIISPSTILLSKGLSHFCPQRLMTWKRKNKCSTKQTR
jgi:hypothetical protein